MAKAEKVLAMDQICKLVPQNGDLAKTLNSVRTVPGTTNPFVVSSRNTNSSTSNRSHPTRSSSGSGDQPGKR